MKLRFLLAAALLLSACKGDEPKRTLEETTKYECSLEVAKKKKATYEGTAQLEGAHSPELDAKVEAAAWADACAKVPESQRADCKKGGDKFTWSAGGGESTVNGKSSVSMNLTLTERPPGFAGSGKSDKSAEEAHATALAEACKAAGATVDCVASGEFEEKNVMQSSETSRSL
jgi:hypothetical protein